MEDIMKPVSYGDPGLTIMDAFDKFEAGDPLGQPEVKPEVVPETPVKKEETAPVKAVVPDEDDGDIEEGFFKADDGKEVPDDKKAVEAKEIDPDAFDKETDELVEGMSKEVKPGSAKSQYDKFKELRQQLKETQTKTVTPEVEQKLAKFEEKELLIKQLNERIEEMSAADAERIVLNGPEYEEQCAQPAARIFSKAEVLAKAYEGDPDVIKRVLLEGDPKKRAELLKTTLEALETTDKIKVELWADEFDTLRAKRGELLAKAETKVAAYEQRRIETQQQELAEHRKAVETITGTLFEKYLPIIPGLADENGKPTQTYKDLKAQVSNIDFTKARPRDLAFAGFAGTVVQHLNKQVRQLQRKLAAYEKGDGETVRADPALGAAGPSGERKSKATNIVELADEMLG